MSTEATAGGARAVSAMSAIANYQLTIVNLQFNSLPFTGTYSIIKDRHAITLPLSPAMGYWRGMRPVHTDLQSIRIFDFITRLGERRTGPRGAVGPYGSTDFLDDWPYSGCWSIRINGFLGLLVWRHGRYGGAPRPPIMGELDCPRPPIIGE